MTYNELNIYIKHYLENDRSGRAIMLTAPWGTGKSYYIENELANYLQVEAPNGKKVDRCVIVSLYGLRDIQEINKSVYLEIRANFLNRKSEKFSAGRIIAKSVVKGIASHFGVDLNISEEELQKLYTSIDLTGKLLVFEDIERAKVNLIEFMGYVNNLVERDGVKVLLVANEKELIKYERKNEIDLDENSLSGTDSVEGHKNNYTEQTEEYLRIKEKTIGDTINFECDFYLAIKEILSNYYEILSDFISDKCIKEIAILLKSSENTNLRSLIFACQKTSDIFNNMKDCKELKKSKFKKSIFYGIILYSLKLKSGEKSRWDGDTVLSITLGSDKYPLYRFCYDYIQYQIFDTNKIKQAAAMYAKLDLYDPHKSDSDKDLHVLYSYFNQTEKELREAILNIENRLRIEDDIAFIQYGAIAGYLVLISDIIDDIDISKCKELLINNLEGRHNNIDEYLLFARPFNFKNKNKKKEFEDLHSAMIKSLKKGKKSAFNFKLYKEDEVDDFYNYCYKNLNAILNDRTFLSEIDLDKFSRMIINCSSKHISNIRSIFTLIYDAPNLNLLNADEQLLCLLENILADKLNSIVNGNEIDKIQIFQINEFISDLKRIKASFKD